MGHGRWSNNDWDSYKTTHTAGKTRQEIFNSSSIKDTMNPHKIALRESRDSKDNPHSTPVILALDVTGSMGMIAENLAREGLGALIEHILARKPVTDPHIMVMGVGDVDYDRAPLQVSQFEADIRIAEQLKDIYLESGGGNNSVESYTLPWYFAARKTDVDVVKQGRKGILFTFGDEECPPDLRADQIRRAIGDQVQGTLSTADLLREVQEKYDVYHVVIEQGNYAMRHKQKVYDSWQKVLPRERIVAVKDYRKLPEILVSVMEVHGGKTQADVVNSWQDPATAAVVKDAIALVQPAAAAVVKPGLKPIKPSSAFKLKPAA